VLIAGGRLRRPLVARVFSVVSPLFRFSV